jgi:hypothetical protein
MYLSKKVKMVLCVVLLMISIALAIGAIFWANNLDHNAYDYGELAYREFTVQSIKQSTGKNARYEIYTNEEQAPLIIGRIGFGATNHQEMDLVKQGDKILCYITTAPTKSFSYEIIDLRTESKIILSLEDYNLREVNDQKIGCILVGVMSILFLCLPIYTFATANKRKI